jgi:molybdate transport system substrate-binding protein
MTFSRWFVRAAVAAAFACACLPAGAADISVLAAVAIKPALDDIARDFERGTGHTVKLAYATAGIVKERLLAGEPADVTIMPKSAFDPVAAQGKIAPGTSIVVARSLVAVAVPAGAPRPDIGSVEAVRRSLLAAKSVVYPDPAKGGATGIHAARVIERLGITAEMRSKTTLVPGSEYAEVLARREAELGIVQPMVVMGVAGVEIVGPLPAELQNTTDFVFWGGIGAAAKDAETAGRFLRFLVAPESARVIRAKGMEPGAP